MSFSPQQPVFSTQFSKAIRLSDQPIIHADMDARMGGNICGPSLIRVPDWVEQPLARYYLYFADHRGRYIRLAYADEIAGKWQTLETGCLDVADSGFCTIQPNPSSPPPYWKEGGDEWRQWLYPHIASPDVHVVDETREIRMYFHGLLENGDQLTRIATSKDGLNFHTLPDLLAPPYLRAFQHDDCWYGIAMPNVLLRSQNGLEPFEPGPELLPQQTRHAAVLAEGDLLHCAWTELGESPERIYYGCCHMNGDWRSWRLEQRTELMRPKMEWEGANAPLSPANWGAEDGVSNQLRDPYFFMNDEQMLLLYTGGGESGIGLAQLKKL